MNDEVQRWLDTAKRERKMASVLAGSGHYEGVAFHCQRAAEKALSVATGEWQRTHSNVELLSGLRRLEVVPTEEVRAEARARREVREGTLQRRPEGWSFRPAPRGSG